MVSRYRRGYAFTSTLEGQEFHLHGEKVVEDPLISSPYPPLSLLDGSFRETDRTCSALLGVGVLVGGQRFAFAHPTNCLPRWDPYCPLSMGQEVAHGEGWGEGRAAPSGSC